MSKLTPDLLRLIDEPNTAHLATLLPDGAPHSVPMWIGREGDRLAFLTSPGSRKARNLDNDPRVAISITNRHKPNDMAYLRGRIAERVEGDRAWQIIDAIADKYIGGPYPLREDRIIYLVEVEHAGTLSF
ncbi:PPOX class F420-dependent oxidoreductase [Flindersiella endophytica]